MTVHSQVCQKGVNLWCAHVLRMSLVMEQDKAFDLPDIRFLRSDAHTLEAYHGPYLIKQFRFDFHKTSSYARLICPSAWQGGAGILCVSDVCSWPVPITWFNF